MQMRGGGGAEQRTLCILRDIQWTPLQRVKYNHKHAMLFSLSFCLHGKILVHLWWKWRKENGNQACTFIPYFAYLRILIGCLVDDNYLLEYQIAKRARGVKEQEEKTEERKNRVEVCKALMIFRVLTVCHLHDDNDQF